MGKDKRSGHQRAQFALVQQARNPSRNEAPSEADALRTALDTERLSREALATELESYKVLVTQLRQERDQLVVKHEASLQSIREELASTTLELNDLQNNFDEKEAEAARHLRSRQRLKSSNKAFTADKRSLKVSSNTLRDEISSLRFECASVRTERDEVLSMNHTLRASLHATESNLLTLRSDFDDLACEYTSLMDSHNDLDRVLLELRKKMHISQMQLLRSLSARARIQSELDTLKKKVPSWVSKRGGPFPPELREICRQLTRAGCSRGKIGFVIRSVAKLFGVEIARVPDRRSVTRFEIEGAVAADLQLGYELLEAKGHAGSSDGTTHKGLVTEVQCVSLLARDWKDGAEAPCVPQTRIVSIHHSADHTSETQKDHWIDNVEGISSTFNRSPLAKRLSLSFTLKAFLKFLHGFSGDHAPDVPCTAKMLCDLRTQIILIELGYDEYWALLSLEHQQHESERVLAAMISSLGGQTVWDALNNEQQEVHRNRALEENLLSHGSTLFDSFSEERKRTTCLFFICGCGMHKISNVSKWAYHGMSQNWVRIPGAVLPVELPNKFQKSAAPPSSDTAAGQKTKIEPKRGALHAVTLAGSLFNNSDPKKGYQDIYVDYMDVHRDLPLKRYGRKFPAVSKIRFNTREAGTAELIAWRPTIIGFLECTRDDKESTEFTNMEANLYKALHDLPTLTEACIISLYSEGFLLDYTNAIRVPKLSMPNLQGLHNDFLEHHYRIRAHPEWILPSTAIFPSERSESTSLDEAMDIDTERPDLQDWKKGTFGGTPWKNQRFMDECKKLAPQLQYLYPQFIQYIDSAISCLENGPYLKEFEKGGAIDTSTMAERRKCYIPATNDHCESALGAARTADTSMTMVNFLAGEMFHRNGTSDFMKVMLTEEEDHSYLRREARERQADGKARKVRKALVEAQRKRVIRKREKVAAKLEKRRVELALLEAVDLITDPSDLENLKSADLLLQIRAWKKVKGDTGFRPLKEMGTKALRVAALKEAIARNGVPAATDESSEDVDMEDPDVSGGWVDEEAGFEDDDEDELFTLKT